MKLLMIKC